jgi:pyruvate/2-oxoglutarate dehydrogenase complex dihydrolipoamide acyltransferase (E2) component
MEQVPIRVPKVSSAAVEAVIVSFLVQDGERVTTGEPLYEVGTDKVDSEVDSAATGVVRWTAKIDATYEIGAQVGYIEVDG